MGWTPQAEPKQCDGAAVGMSTKVRMGSWIGGISAFRLKTKTSAKYGLSAQPRLVDIIAAVPPQYRKVLVPKLKAKPIRTASGVSTSSFSPSTTVLSLLSLINYRGFNYFQRGGHSVSRSFNADVLAALPGSRLSSLTCLQGCYLQNIWGKRKRCRGFVAG